MIDNEANGIFQFATTFLIASKRCMIKRKLPTGSIEWPLIPALILLVFAIELNLKAIILHNGEKAHGHDLLELYRQLKCDQKVAIFLDMKMSQDAFETELKKHSISFVKWRYLYEYPDQIANIRFLENLSDNIHSLAEKTCQRGEDDDFKNGE